MSDWPELPQQIWLVRYRWSHPSERQGGSISKLFKRRREAEEELLSAWKEHDDLYDVEVWVMKPQPRTDSIGVEHMLFKWQPRSWVYPSEGGIR